VSEVLVRYWAAAKAAAGRAEETFPHEPDLAALLDAVRARHGADGRLAEVLARCAYLVDEVSPGRRAAVDVAVPEGAVVDVLPPFAGGSSTGEHEPSAGGSSTGEHEPSAGGSSTGEHEPSAGGSSVGGLGISTRPVGFGSP
jgi:sulfur-carrier protein